MFLCMHACSQIRDMMFWMRKWPCFFTHPFKPSLLTCLCIITIVLVPSCYYPKYDSWCTNEFFKYPILSVILTSKHFPYTFQLNRGKGSDYAGIFFSVESFDWHCRLSSETKPTEKTVQKHALLISTHKFGTNPIISLTHQSSAEWLWW